MSIYQFLFFDSHGDFPALDVAECADDGAAVRSAVEQLAEHASCRGVAVFEADRLVMRVERPAAEAFAGSWSMHAVQ